MKALLAELKKAKANSLNHFVDEKYEVNVRFVDKTKGMNMILDSCAQVSITNRKLIINHQNDPTKKFERDFIFMTASPLLVTY